MKMSDSAWLLLCNTLKLACFVGLAMYFGRWWIVLFVALFWTYIESHGGSKDENA